MGICLTYRKKLQDHLFMKTPLAQPTNLWVALSTADPGVDGASLAEPTGGYARAETDGDDWSAADVNGLSTSLTQFSFGAASGDWGTITHVAIVDTVSAGQVVARGVLVTPRTVNTGDTLIFAIGEIDIQILDDLEP